MSPSNFHRVCDRFGLVCDEAHRCTGRLTKRDAKPLDDALLPAAKRLFLTATPRLIDRSRASGRLELVHSMDDVSVYGPEVYRLGYRDAVSAGVIVERKLCAPLVTDAEYAERAAARALAAGRDVREDERVPGPELARRDAAGRGGIPVIRGTCNQRGLGISLPRFPGATCMDAGPMR